MRAPAHGGVHAGLNVADGEIVVRAGGDLQIGDQLEAFETIEVKRKLGKTLADEQAEAEKKNAAAEVSAE